jgi:NodT family efflux transporter outer membrane factor (OMF) lipoprotein
MTRFFVLGILLFLTGCIHVGPDFKSPKAPTESAWIEESDRLIVTPQVDVGPWWARFHDDTLNDLIEYALQENYTLEAAAKRIVAARANLGVAIGEFFPQTQQIEGSFLREHISKNAPNTLGIDRQYGDGILGGRIAWELDFWGRFYRGIQSAYGEYVASKDDYSDVQRLIVSDLALAYIQYKTFLQRIAILESNIAAQRRSSEIAKVRFEEGFDSELDYAQAVSLWKETEAQQTSLQIEVKRTLTSMAILTGLTPEQFLCHFTIDSTPIYLPTTVAIGYPAEVLYQRPDLRRSLDRIFSQNANVGIAVSDLFPRISFTGFLGLECATDTHSTANQSGKHFFSPNSLTFFYGPTFFVPFLDYCRFENRVVQQYAILDQDIALYRNQVLVAFKEVEDALTFYVKSIEGADELEISYKAAKRSVDISTLQYSEGIADYSRVLNSLQLQVSAEDALAQALGNIALAYTNIFRSLGTF